MAISVGTLTIPTTGTDPKSADLEEMEDEIEDLLQGVVDQLGSAAEAEASDFATAAQGALAASAIQPGNAALSDAREWTASTVTQAEAEAGSSTTRRAWTAERVKQAIAAWITANLATAWAQRFAVLAGKATLADADQLGLIDSDDSDAPKKATWANIKATLAAQMTATFASTGTVAAMLAETPHAPGLIRWRYGYGTSDSIANGAPEALPEAPASLVETVAGRGRVIRLDETDAVLADRSLITLTPESVTEVFATFRRITDTTDPANDTVRVAIRWLDASFAAVGTDEVLDDIELTASMEAWRTAALVSRESDLGADVVAPAGAAYGRLYLKAFGTNGETDVELMGHHDATRVAALLQLIS